MTHSSAFDDDDLALSINPSHTRRGSARSPSENPPQHDPMQNAAQLRRPPDPVKIPTGNMRLGQYKVVRTLGEGSFGKVKLAVHESSNQKVALKIISRRKLMARDMVGRCEREIQYLQLLRHPHIIKLFTVITTDKEIVMVLEYAGHELFNYIVEHGKMAEDKARAFFQQIVCAVEYCHRHKIVHRDLKPENLLLDENLHVKIADFGLSNIMTDGNFLKTSCGSPNYAAPEVISGKLYAGPEVDVWSCGVILYVLLVGKLPFDDEYIPALFKKIAQGSYHIPNYVSKPAANLIKRMLQVNPVNRITVQEIRQDPWFIKNMPDYLKPPVEEFLDTGVDPNKAIDPRSLAPTKPLEVVEKLHNSVVGKLGKTMGYGREDVQQALSVDEPNAIKDAYLIVRENQIMRDTPSMARDPTLQPFLASSPEQDSQSPIASINEKIVALPPPTSSSGQRPDVPRLSSDAGTKMQARSPGGTIAVLPSSVPSYHTAFMEGRPQQVKQSDDEKEQSSQGADAATRRRLLNPHSRSQLNLDRMNKPSSLTPVAAEKKKPKPTKWQFGIRSRNPPAEAMLAIYRALKAMGADWEVPKPRRPGEVGEGTTRPQRDEVGIEGSSDEDSDGSSNQSPGNRTNSDASFSNSPLRGRRRADTRYGSWNDWGYKVPSDPWIINARFKKGEMFPPGVVHPGSSHSSSVDLADNDPNSRRRSSATNSATSATGSGQSSKTNLNSAVTSNPETNSLAQRHTSSSSSLNSPTSVRQIPAALTTDGPVADDSAFVYLTIQLYALGTRDQEMYVVDFKCAGYERLVRRLIRLRGDEEAVEGEEENNDEAEAKAHADSDEGDDAGDDFTIGRPKEGGNWDALKQRQGSGKARSRETSDQQKERAGKDDAEIESKDFAAPVRASSRVASREGSTMGAETPDEDSGVQKTYASRSYFDDNGSGYAEELIGDGRANEEKDVSSPFPFLDVASRLIIQLAEAS